MSQNVTHSPPPSAQAEAEAEAEAKGTKTLVETVAPEPKKPRLAGASPTAKLTDDEWLEGLTRDSTYEGIDVRREHGKMLRWCEAHRKQPTRKRFVNWLNRADRTFGANGTASKPKLEREIADLRYKLERERDPVVGGAMMTRLKAAKAELEKLL